MGQDPQPFTTLSTRIRRNLERAGSHKAVIFRGRPISSACLNAHVLAMREGLRQAGIAPGHTLGVTLERSPDTLILLLALWELGAVYVPIDPDQPMLRIDAMVQGSALDFLVLRPEQQAALARCSCEQILLAPLDTAHAPSIPETDAGSSPPVSPQSCAYIMHTSGTSGRPKGVRISHGSLSHLLDCMIPLLQLKPDCIVLGCSSFSFDISLFEILTPLLLSGTLILMDQDEYRDPLAIMRALDTYAPHVMQATPSRWQLLINSAFPAPGKHLLAISTGEALAPGLAQQLLERVGVLWNLYGPTECTLWATGCRVSPAILASSRSASVSIGRLLPGYLGALQHGSESAAALDLSPPPGSRGELLIGGPGLALDYAADPALSEAKFSVHRGRRYYHSGDICEIDAGGHYHYHGRLDSQIKFNGYRIEATELDQLLENHPCLEAACVKTEADHHGRNWLIAFVVHKKGLPNKTAASLNTYLKRHLPDAMLPQRYCFLERIPLSPAGKKDREALHYQHQRFKRGQHDPTFPQLEHSVAEIFCQVLGLSAIGRYDSFFDHGGNSMLAATLLLKLNQELHCSVSLKALLASPPTVSSVSLLVSRHSRA